MSENNTTTTTNNNNNKRPRDEEENATEGEKLTENAKKIHSDEENEDKVSEDGDLMALLSRIEQMDDGYFSTDLQKQGSMDTGSECHSGDMDMSLLMEAAESLGNYDCYGGGLSDMYSSPPGCFDFTEFDNGEVVNALWDNGAWPCEELGFL